LVLQNKEMVHGESKETMNIINRIKAQRISWFGHLHRIPEERIVKKGIQVKTDVNTTTRETKEQMGR